MKWTLVVDLQLIPPQEGRRVLCGPHEVALFNLGTEFRAVGNQCPHRQGPLADGIVAGGAVFCPLHNMKVSLETGCALAGGQGQVKVYPVRVHDGNVYIAFEEGSLCALDGVSQGTGAADAESIAADVN